MDVEHLLTATRSARRSLDIDAPVDPVDIRDCLRIALQAPNGTNQQSWRWLVITDRQLRAEIARRYRDAYLLRTGGQLVGDLFGTGTDVGKLMSSTEWLVEHMAEVPMLVIPCFEAYVPRIEGDDAFQNATVYGSIFPAVWNFQLALHDHGYGTCITTLHLHYAEQVADLLGIPSTFTQGCLLPVARLRAGQVFRPAPRRSLDEVVSVDGWDGKPL